MIFNRLRSSVEAKSERQGEVVSLLEKLSPTTFKVDTILDAKSEFPEHDLQGVFVAPDAGIQNLTHLRRQGLEAFTTDMDTPGGKFGTRGIYFAAGDIANLSGESFNLLKSDPNVHKHTVSTKGNFLIIEHGVNKEGANQRLLRYLERKQGIPVSKLSSRSIVGNYIDLLEDVKVCGRRVDGVVILLPAGNVAEVIIAKHHLNKVRVDSVSALNS